MKNYQISIAAECVSAAIIIVSLITYLVGKSELVRLLTTVEVTVLLALLFTVVALVALTVYLNKVDEKETNIKIKLYQESRNTKGTWYYDEFGR